MNAALLILLALLPIALYSYLIYRADKYEKEPLAPLAISFALGALITLPAVYLEEVVANQNWFDLDMPLPLFLYVLIGVAIIEEALKCIVFFAFPFRSKYFNEPFDGVVYAVMVSMGFAAVENVIYVLQYGPETGVLRALTAVPAHAVFGIISGYYFGRAKFEPNRKWPLIALGFIAAILFHTLYDFFILQNFSQYLMLGSAVGIYLLSVLGYFMVRNSLYFSPFKEKGG